MTSSPTAAHVLVIPYPAQGHMIPLLDLTHHLLSRGPGLSFTVVVTPNNLPILQPLLSCHPPATLSALVLPFPPHPSLPAGTENVQHLPPKSFIPVMSSFRRLRRPLLRWFSSHPSPPSSILSDMFLGWTHRLASDLGIKRFIFSTSGAFAFSVATTLWNTLPPVPRSEDGSIDENAVVSFDQIPGQPRFPWSQLSILYRVYASGDPSTEFLVDNSVGNSASWGLVVNTCADLEAPYLSYLETGLGFDRTWAVGPVLPPEGVVGFGPSVRGGSGPVKEERVLPWLDTCGAHQVVYVCFGSQAVLTNKQMEVLAVALERSGVRFVWKVKEPTKGHVDGDSFGKLPSGFEDRLAASGKGLVVRDWVPQVSILRHPAVGTFLTHCGWNSVLEGLSAGTMMLAWPQGADQFSNTTLLEWLNVGVKVGQGAKSLPDPDELARVLAASLNGSYKEQRLKALELKMKVAQAVSQGGSSLNGLDSLVQHLSTLPKPDPEVIRRCESAEADEEEVARVVSC